MRDLIRKNPVLFSHTSTPLRVRGLLLPTLRTVFASTTLALVLLVLPLFSFTRVHNAGTSTGVSAGASLRADTRTNAGTALRTLLSPATASAAASDNLNFQARLQTAGGAIVPDGYYNIQFKLYSAASGGSALWTETYAYNSGSGACTGPLGANDCRVRVVNGYVSVYLGSQTAFPGTMPWDQQLYLTMNIGGSVTTGSYPTMGDGEMSPRLKLTAVPYAMQSKQASQLSTSNGALQSILSITAPTVGNQTFVIQDQGAAGTFNLLTAPSGSDGYVKLQTTSPGTQQTGNLNISGTSIANIQQATTSVVTPTLDTATGVALNIGATGTPVTTQINLNQNTVLAAGKTIRITGGITSSRPTPTTEGVLYYDTDTNQLLVSFLNADTGAYQWKASGQDAVLVAANDSSDADKAAADYVTTGTSDQTIINYALTAASSTGTRKSGKVYLFAGTYTTSDSIIMANNVTLAGSGRGTLIKFANLAGASKDMIVNSDTTTGEGIVIRDLRIDGNTANVAGTVQGIYLNRVGSASGSRQGPIIANIYALNFRSNAIRFDNNTSNGTITGSNFQANGTGVYLSSGNRLSVTNNVFLSNTNNGMVLAGTLYDTISANNFITNSTIALQLSGSSQYNTINANNFYDNTGSTANSTILVAGTSKDNVITNNEIIDTAGTGYAINISDSGSTTNYLSNNYFSGTGATSINDASTNTIYANQSRSASGGQLTVRTTNDTQAFAVQNATGANIFAVDTTNNQIVLGNSTTAGQITMSSGNAFSATIVPATFTADRKFILPDTALATTASPATICVYNGATSNCPAATGSSFYLWNSSSVQNAANYYLRSAAIGSAVGVLEGANGQTADLLSLNTYNGTTSTTVARFTAAGDLQVAGTVDTATSTALNVGTANATVINLNQSTVLAAGKSITVTGGNTASRPGSPTEGMLYYDTTTKQLLVYANGKWQADRSTATKIVGTSAAGGASGAVASFAPDGADYVNASTTSAQTAINNALTAIGTNGGTVYLMEGTYIIDGSISIPNNVTLTGAGSGTVIKLKNGINADFNAIVATDVSTATGIVVSNLRIDGNRTNQTTATQIGIYFQDVGAGSGSGARQGAKITDFWISNFQSYGIMLKGTSAGNSNNTVISNGHLTNDYMGMYLKTSTNITVSDNVIQGAGSRGIYGEALGRSTIVNNVFDANISGITLGGSSTVITVTGNEFSGSSNAGVDLNSVSASTVTGNTFVNNGGSTTNEAILVEASASGNSVTNNTITDNTYTSNNYAIDIASGATATYLAGNTLGTGSINDAGTGTTYGGQLTTSTGAFTIQNAGGVNVTSSATSAASTNSADISITTGNATGATSNSGNISLDTGTATGTKGTISIGTGNASAITIGKAGMTTTIQGAAVISQNATVGGNLGINNASPTNRLTLNAYGTGSYADVQAYINTGASTNRGLVIQVAPSQSVSPFQIVDSAGSVLSGFTAGGRAFYASGAAIGAAILTVSTGTSAGIGAYIQGTSGQTADLLRVADNNAVSLAGFTATGALNLGNTTTLVAGSTARAGSIIFGDGSATTVVTPKTGTLQLQGALASNQTYLLPTTGGTLLTTAAADAAYIQNQTAVAQTAGFNISGAATIVGATNINATGAAATNIGTGTGNTSIGNTTGTLGLTGSTVSVLGATSINTTGTATTTVGSNTAGAVSITSNAASNFTTNTGLLTLQGMGGVSVLSTGGTTSSAITIGTGNASAGASGAISIDTGTASTTTGTISIGTGNASAVSIGKTTTTVTIQGSLTSGNAAGTGTFTNNGSTLNTSLVLGDLAAGAIGANTATVDKYTSFTISPTASGRTYTIPAPTGGAAGRTIYISNINATNTFIIGSTTFNTHSTATLVYDGNGWNFAGMDGGSNNYIQNQTAVSQPASFNIGGTATIVGATNVNATGAAVTNIGTGTGNTAIGNTTGTLGLTGSTVSVLGTTSINTSGTGTTSIGNGSSGAVTIGNGTTGAIALQSGTSIGLTGVTNINASANNITNINTGTSTAAVNIGNSLAGNISLQSAGTISVLGTTSINTTGTGTTTIGSTAAGAVSITSNAASNFTTNTGLLSLQGAGGVSILTPAAASTSGITIVTGNASAGASGNISIDTGTATTTTGTISIGTGNASAVNIGKTTTTTTVLGSFTSGNTAGTGTFTNNGSTKNTTSALGDLAAGAIGANTATVDIYTSFTISPTASGRTYTIPAPSDGVAGRTIYISNINATNTFVIGSTTFNTHSTATLVYDGTSWNFAGMDGGSNNYIQNQNSSTQTANFRINGTGQVAGIDALSGAGLALGGTNATSLTLGNTTNTTSISFQAAAAGSITIGSQTVANTINVGTVGTAAFSSTINIGTSTGAAQTVNIGSNSSTGTVTITSGSGGIGLTGNTTINTSGSGTTSIGNGSSGTVTIGNSATGALSIQSGTSIGIGRDSIINTIAGSTQLSGTTTAAAYKLNINGTLNSSVTTFQFGFQNQLNFNPSGGSISGGIYALNNIGIMSGTALTIPQFVGTNTRIDTAAGFTGTITNGYGINVNSPQLAGGKIDNYYGVAVGDVSANGGNTSGTRNNSQIYVYSNTAAAGAGGTINNYGIKLIQPSGAGAGATNNYGLYLTGNGGGSLNYAIYNDSTAANYIQGNTSIGSSSNPNAYNLNVVGTTGLTGNTFINSTGGSTTTIGSTAAGAVSITSNAASNFTTNTGALTLQGAGGVTIASTAGTTSSAISITTGNASAGASGNITIDTGTNTSGTPTINLGAANADFIYIGNANALSNFKSNVIIDGNTTYANTKLLIQGELQSNATNNPNYQQGFSNSVVFNPTGDVTNTYGFINNPYLTGATNTTTFAAGVFSLNTKAAYTGTITNGYGILIGDTGFLGTNKVSNYSGIYANGVTNNAGNTSGTISNTQINVRNSTASPGANGAINNTGVHITLATGNDAAGGTASVNNRALEITGNGGTSGGGAGTTNYAIYNNSTARNYIQGTVSIGIDSTAYGLYVSGTSNFVGNATINTSGSGTTSIGTGSTGTVTIGNGTTGAIGIVSGSAITTTAGAASTWSTTTGLLTVQGGSGLSLLTANAATSSAITIQTGNSTAGTAAAVTIDTGTSTAGSGTINIGTTNAGIVNIGKAVGTTNIVSNTTTLGTTGGTIVLQGVAQATASTTGNAVTIKAGAGGSGNANGGTLTISGGDKTGTGVMGLVSLNPAAFAASSTVTLSANNTLNALLANGTNNYGTVPINATSAGYVLTVDLPTVTTVGRILYITGVNGSSDFNLVLAGTAVSINMKANSTATLIYNGTGWTAAGASSSTDLQAAYNNTQSTAGGAEIVLGASGGQTDGLTIRNNGTPIVGALLEVQSSIAANLFSVNSNTTEYALNGGAESSTFTGNWANISSSVTQNTNAAYVASGRGSVGATVTASNQGVKDTLSTTLTPSTTYVVSFAAKLGGSLTSNTLNIYYSINGTAQSAPCNTSLPGTGYTVSPTFSVSNSWTKVSCFITTPASGLTSSNAILIYETDFGTGTNTFYVDNLSVISNAAGTTPANVQIGGGTTGGQPTLFTLDQFAGPPMSTNNSAYYGSMYYDTTRGAIQCYQSSGWGACGSAPDDIVSMTPEYTGAVLNGTGVGTMTADFCGNGSGLSVNTGFCASGEARNYYRWVSPQPTPQTYSIYVTYRLPSTFKTFVSGSANLTGLVDNTTNAGVSYAIYRKASGGGLTSCSASKNVVGSGSGSVNTWTTAAPTTDLSGCTDFVAGDSIVFQITVTAKSNASAYVENLTFQYSNK